MKLAVMQPYIFPYLGYFQLINSVDKYILYHRLTFIKDSWMNRNRILHTGMGEPFLFTIPLLGKSSNELINKVKIHNQFNWQKKLLSTVFFNYKRAPYFTHVYPLVEKIINFPCEYLNELNCNSVTEIAHYLNINTLISTDEPYFDDMEQILSQRDVYFPDYDVDQYPVKVLRALEICKKEGAHIFYNAIGGRQLYDQKLFKKHDIELQFIKTKPYVYRQFQQPFVPDLSIIDVMMFNPPEKITELLNHFELV
jgi:hypothetical protein